MSRFVGERIRYVDIVGHDYAHSNVLTRGLRVGKLMAVSP